MSKKLSKKDIHNAADKANISWDNDPKFLIESEKITGKKHLDKMTRTQLSKVLNEIKNNPNRFDKKSHFIPGKFKLKSKNEKGEPEFEHFRTNHDYTGENFLDKVERRVKTLSKYLKKKKHTEEAAELDKMLKSVKPKKKHKKKASQEFVPLPSANVSITLQKTVPLWSKYKEEEQNMQRKPPWYCGGEAEGVCWVGETWEEGVEWIKGEIKAGNDEFKILTKFKSREECQAASDRYCEKEREKENKFRKAETPFVDIVSSDIINAWTGFYGPKIRSRSLYSEDNVSVGIYKISSSPEYFSMANVAHIYEGQLTSVESVNTLEQVLNVTINKLIEYLNQERTRYAFRSKYNRDINVDDLKNTLQKIRYIILDPRDMPSGGESWRNQGVIVLPSNITAENIYNTFWHELITHALGGMTPKEAQGIAAAYERKTKGMSPEDKAKEIQSTMFGGAFRSTTEDEEYGLSQAQKMKSGLEMFKHINVPEFEKISREDLQKKLLVARARTIDEEIEDYKSNFSNNNSNLNDDQLVVKWNKEGAKELSKLIAKRDVYYDKHRRLIKYRTEERWIKEKEEYTDWDGTNKERTVWVSSHSPEQQRAFREEFVELEDTHRIAYEQFISIFGEGHHLEKTLFKNKILNYDNFRHLMDEAHRQGALRILYFALSKEYGKFPIEIKVIEKAIKLKMPKQFYRNNPDLFRFLFLLPSDGGTIQRIYDAQFQIVKRDEPKAEQTTRTV